VTLIAFFPPLWLFALLAAFLFGKANPERTRHSVSWLLMSSSGILVIAAGLGWLTVTRDVIGLCVFIGMALGCLGDLTLAGYIPGLHGTLPGLIAFAGNHIAYLIAFGLLALKVSPSPVSVASAITLYALAAVFVWWAWAQTPTTAPSLRYGSLVYTLLIAAMTGLATALAFHQPTFWSLALGANLFLLSDMLLGNQIFRQTNRPYVHDVIWLLYGSGQASIVFSFVYLSLSR